MLTMNINEVQEVIEHCLVNEYCTMAYQVKLSKILQDSGQNADSCMVLASSNIGKILPSICKILARIMYRQDSCKPQLDIHDMHMILEQDSCQILG